MGHYSVPTEPSSTRRHETQKPLRLMKNLVLDFTMPGDLISDPYGGAGTTGMAARVTGRRYVLWEMDKDHAERSSAWIGAASEQLSIERMYHRARGAAFGDEPQPSSEQSEMNLAASSPAQPA
ncbi:MAG: DNA methyltransferase [Gammaproteobacteria bacterium]|nr:DNA methyltransferase [Gammaproteobacteria bacterium]